MGQASARAEIGEQLVFNFGRAGGFGVVQQKGQRSAGGQAWEEPGVWDNLRAGVGNWRESWTTRGTTLGLPLPSKDLYRYSLIPRGPGSVEPKSTPRAIATCCSLFLRTDNEADKTAREDEASREREKKKRGRFDTVWAGVCRRLEVFFPGGCQRDVLANLDSICQCSVGLFERGTDE